MAIIQTTRGPLRDTSLLKREDRWEDDDRIVEAVEYCAADCDGIAHQRNAPQGDGCFCAQHVHRTVHVTAKRWPAMGVVAASLT